MSRNIRTAQDVSHVKNMQRTNLSVQRTRRTSYIVNENVRCGTQMRRIYYSILSPDQQREGHNQSHWKHNQSHWNLVDPTGSSEAVQSELNEETSWRIINLVLIISNSIHSITQQKHNIYK